MDNTDSIDFVVQLANRRLTAEAKFVLIHVLRQFDYGVVDERVKGLAGQMGMTDKVFKKARDLLIELGYLFSVQRGHDGRLGVGRPKKAFQITAKTIEEFNDFCINNPIPSRIKLSHQTRINKLLFEIYGASHLQEPTANNDGKKIPKRQSGNLTPANRLLLAILYRHANECGAVRGLGLSKLQGLAGLTAARLETQLGKLSEMGYLLARVSGVTGRHLIGRSTGAFFLNVFNDDLGNDEDSAVLVLMQTEAKDHFNEEFWGLRIFRESRSKRQELLKHDYLSKLESSIKNKCLSTEDIEEKLTEIRSMFLKQDVFEAISVQSNVQDSGLIYYIIDQVALEWRLKFECFNLQNYFQDEPLLTFAKFLQYKINEYASIILSQFWENLGINPINIQEDILDKISDEIYPENLRKKSDDEKHARLIAEAIGLYIYRASFEVALQAKWHVQNALKTNTEIKLNQLPYTLLPVQYESNFANKLSIAVKLTNVHSKERFIAIHVTSMSRNITATRTPYDAGASTERDALLKSFGYGVKTKESKMRHSPPRK